mgnify:CR=1 FL=1
MNRKVSIITPVFNRLKELTRLYETLNNQTNDNFIWIIIDVLYKISTISFDTISSLSTTSDQGVLKYFTAFLYAYIFP